MRNGRWLSRMRGTASRFALVLLSATIAASGCLSDAQIPACLKDEACGAKTGGAPPDAMAAGQGGGAGAVGIGGAGRDSNDDTVMAGFSGGGDGGDTGGGLQPCPDCSLAPAQLPPPCLGNSYEVALQLTGGEPPFSWRVAADSGDWAIHGDLQDPRAAILTGEDLSAGVTKLRITVTGSDQRSAQVPYDLFARESCWFAYTSLTDSGPTLQLMDPFVADFQPEALEHNSDVYDFSFSPDGRYLAYSYGASPLHPHGQHVSLVQLSGHAKLNEARLDLGEDAITSFAWSPDSSVLAVAFSAGDSGYLGAVGLPAGDVRTSVSAIVGSELSWVGNEYVAYHTDLWDLHPADGYPLPTDDGDHYRTHSYAQLTPTGFSRPVEDLKAYLAPIVLLPTSVGFYTLGDPTQQVFTLPEGTTYRQGWHASSRLISGSGDYAVALADDGGLRIFTAEVGDVVAPEASSAPGETCTHLLAWATGSERLACVTDFGDTSEALPHGEIRFFDFTPDSASLSMFGLAGACSGAGGCGPTGYRYDSAQAQRQARAFSRSGRWFAFTTTFNGFRWLHWTDLQGQTPHVSRLLGFASDGPSWVSFSPDERLLLARLGGELALVDLAEPPAPSQLPFLPFGAGPGVDCSEKFMHEPQRYCAGSPASSDAVWSADSSALAHQAADGVRVVDTSQTLTKPSWKMPGARCDDRCSGRLAFQPAY